MKLLSRLLLCFLLAWASWADFCKREFMNAYFLDGLLEPDNRKSPLCPAVKENCCTEKDIMTVLDKFANHLRPKRADYKTKFKRALWQLGLLHADIFRIQQRVGWEGKQRLFCQNKFAEFSTFPFAQMMDQLKTGFDIAYENYEKMHQSFLCVLCDYDAHQSMLISTQQMAVDGAMCLEQLNRNKEFLTAQNIQLVDYLQKMQNYLDCTLFDYKYNFPLVFSTEVNRADDFTKCYDKLTPDSLDKECVPLCGELKLGVISPVFEGNHFFINRAIAYYRDIISQINFKYATTAFNPLQSLAPLNANRSEIKFFNVPDKQKNRLKFMLRKHFHVPENNHDDFFRNDERTYTGEDEPETDKMPKVIDLQALMPKPPAPPAPPRPAAPPCRGFFCRLRLPKIDLGGIANAAKNAIGGAVNAASSAIGGAVNAASGLVSQVASAAPGLIGGAMNAASGLVGGLMGGGGGGEGGDGGGGGDAGGAAPAPAGGGAPAPPPPPRPSRGGGGGGLGGLFGAAKGFLSGGGLGKALSAVKGIAGAVGGVANVVNSVMDSPLGGIIKMGASFIPGGGAIVQGVSMAAKVAGTASKMASALPGRKLVLNEDRSITIIEKNWRVHVLHDGDAYDEAEGLVNLGGKLYLNGQEVVMTDLDDTGEPLQETPQQPALAPVQAQVQAKPKSHPHSKKLSKAKPVTSHKPQQHKKARKLRVQAKAVESKGHHLKQHKKSKHFTPKRHLAPSKHSKHVIRSTQKSPHKPLSERELIQKVTSLIDSNFKAQKSEKAKIRMHKRHNLRRRRVLEALFQEEQESLSDHPNGRLLAEVQTTINDYLFTNPVKYFEQHYESINFQSNFTVPEIFPCVQNTLDIANFKPKIISAAGIDLQFYVSTVNFEYTKNQLAMVLKGQKNLDPFDFQMSELIKACNNKFLALTLATLASSYSLVVQPAYQSEDDKELQRLEPTYGKEESFQMVDGTYFDTEFETYMYKSTPGELIQRKTIHRRLKQIHTMSAEERLKERSKAIGNAFRIF